MFFPKLEVSLTIDVIVVLYTPFKPMTHTIFVQKHTEVIK